MPGFDTLTILCPAKINLALSVGAPDPARGHLHPIASWMVTLGFADTLHLRATPDQRTTFDLAFAEDAPRPEPIDWPLDNDLAYRAHRLLEAHVGRALPVHATLRKRIPTGAGLGGGSSDAAGMLFGLNRLFDLRLPDATFRELAGQLGSDVVFLTAALAQGMTGALVTGTGDTLADASPKAPLQVVLLLPPHHCPTGAVYRAFDELRPDAAVDEPRVRALTQAAPLDGAACFNDLAAAALHVCPALRELRDAIQQTVPYPIHITGSGAAMFLLAECESDASRLARTITATHDIPTIATATLTPPAQ